MRSLTAKVVIILLLSAATVFGQDFHVYGFSMLDYSFLGSGARARGMGGAFTGVSDDASALTWCAAGLVQVDKTQASVSGTFSPLKTMTTMTFPREPWHNQRSSAFNNDIFGIGYASFVAPVRIKGHPFMASVAYQSVQNQIEDKYNWQNLQLRSGAFSSAALTDSRTTLSGNLNQISFGFGTGLYGDVSFGASANIYSGSSESTFRSSWADTVPGYYGNIFVDSILVGGVTQVSDKANQKGFNFSGSLMYRKDKLRIAINLRTPFDLVSDHDLARGDTNFIKGLSSETPGDGPPIAIDSRMFRGKTKYKMPLDVSGGISYQPTPNLVISADAEYQQFSKAKYYVRSEKTPEDLIYLDSIDMFTPPGSMYYSDSGQTTYYNSAGELVEIYREYELNFYNRRQLRLGAEYSSTTSVGVIPVRGGLRIVQGPYRDVKMLTQNYQGSPQPGFVLGDRINYTVVTFGAGIHWRQIWLDCAVEVSNEKHKEAGTNALGDYTLVSKRTGPRYSFNFTGFF